MCCYRLQWHQVVCCTSISFNVKEGELVAVVGQVGSGKSSLVSSLLGDMIREDGDVILRVCSAFHADTMIADTKRNTYIM